MTTDIVSSVSGSQTNLQRAASVESSSPLTSDFETFLRLLTTQLENQDPLNPQQANDFAVDLATFSTVEQQVLTNDYLEQMSEAQGLGGLGEIAGWIGLEARGPVPANYDGQPVTVYPNISADADQATLIVRDDQGAVISSVAIVATNDPVTWDGTDALGTPMPPGRYSFEIEARAAGEFLSREPAEVYARVTETRIENGVPVLVIGGTTIAPEEISALRSPGAT